MAASLIEAEAILDSGLQDSDELFQVLAAIGQHGAFEDRAAARNLLIRTLDQRVATPPGLDMLFNGLVREHGLFPYLSNAAETLPLPDRIALEAHRPDALPGRDVVFHAEQAEIYRRLMAGENIILSAPTSFGKSLLIDAVLAAREFTNAAVIVPTIALIDEMRRRLALLGDRYKIISHGSQSLAERNLFVMTQERMLDLETLPHLDFFAIDEFYKLDPAHSDDRANQLNVLFNRLLGTGAQFYLLGPNIHRIAAGTLDKLNASFVVSGYNTVVTEIERVRAERSELPDKLAEACRDAGPQTMVFCSSPARTREVARWLLDRDIGGDVDLDDVADWVASAYHPDWLVGRALRAGIGIHHGRLPRALAHHIVRLFNEKRLPYLLVTSTLIEGVNTTARTVVVLDNKIANKRYDYFTFSNIRGRSGRMSQYFVGKVIVFNPEPQASTETVDVPVISQTPAATDEMLIQLPYEQLTPESRARVQPYYDQQLVSIDTLRKNHLAPDRQIRAAETIRSDPRRWGENLRWRNGFPTAAQVRELADLMYPLIRTRSQAVRTAAQLGARLNILRHHRGDIRALVAEEIERRDTEPDDAVEEALDFVRNWAQFHVPRGLSAIERLARDVMPQAAIADTRPFAGQIEGVFQPRFAAVLEDYGLPLPVTLKLEGRLHLDQAEDLDDALARLRAVSPNVAGLMTFEREMLVDTQDAL